MGEILKTDGLYVGREFVKKGQKLSKKTKQPMVGDKNQPIMWEMWKLKFKHNPDSPFAVGFGTFDTHAETKYGLQAGERYIIEYYEQANKKYPDKPHKTFVNAIKGALPANHEERVEQAQVTESYEPEDLMKEFEGFKATYKEMVPQEKQNPVHMAGMFLINTFEGDYFELYKKCCEVLGVKTK